MFGEPDAESPACISESEDKSSSVSAGSYATVTQEPLSMIVPSCSHIVMPDSDSENHSFGNPIQKFSKDIINSLSKYKVSEDLSDTNYPTWSQSIKEVFRSMSLDKFITVKNYSDSSLSKDKNEITAFNITTYILNRLDNHNNTQARNHLTDPDDPSEILYDPFKCWTYLKLRHNEITGDKLTAVTKALLSCKILKSDTLTSYLDKFENIVWEYYYYRGQMPDSQTARMLILSIPTLPETTIELIHATVKPLTRKGVSDYLRQYEQRHEWTSSAMREVNGVSATGSSGSKKNSGPKCTEDVCVGPHPSKECWSKPENHDKRDRFIFRRRGNPSANSTTPNKVRGVKKVNKASTNSVTSTDVVSFHTSYEDVIATANAVQKSPDDSALHDTGATHHVFKDETLFDDSLFISQDGSSKRLKLAGGGVSLNVKGVGLVKLKAGDGTVVELKECLWVPEVARNLIAGGLLKSKGVRELFDENDPTHFSLVRGDLAVFNGYIGSDNLMHILLEQVSP